MAKGTILETLTWTQAEAVLAPESVVVIPLGAAAKEHGPHLQLNNDWLIAEFLKNQLIMRCDVVIAPTIGCFYYPAFVEYPGSITLSERTARNLIAEVCSSLAAFGPRRFYVINTGISTLGPLSKSAERLRQDGIILRFTNLDSALGRVEKEISQQEGGTHADEIETSIMLFIAPETVDMTRSTRDFHAGGTGGLTRRQQHGRCFSPSGVWGDATLATREKGEKIVKCLVDAVVTDVEDLRLAPLPEATPQTPDPADPP